MGDFERLSALMGVFVKARGWGHHHTPKNLVMALSSEVGELNDIFRWLSPEQASAVMSDPVLAENVRGELADVQLFLVALARVLAVDLVEVSLEKMAANGDRFPVGQETRIGRP